MYEVYFDHLCTGGVDTFKPIVWQKTCTDGWGKLHAVAADGVLESTGSISGIYTASTRSISRFGTADAACTRSISVFDTAVGTACTRVSVLLILPILAAFGPLAMLILILPVLAVFTPLVLQCSQYSAYETHSIILSLIHI